MKRLLFILMSIFISGSYVYAQNIINRTEITLYKDDKEGHQVDPEEAPKTRSLIVQPAHAYLYNKVVSVSFEEVMPIVIIKIVKEATGETVYSQEYMSPASISVDLTLQEPGTYYIEIVSNEICLQGEFIL